MRAIINILAAGIAVGLVGIFEIFTPEQSAGLFCFLVIMLTLSDIHNAIRKPSNDH